MKYNLSILCTCKITNLKLHVTDDPGLYVNLIFFKIAHSMKHTTQDLSQVESVIIVS